MRDQNQLHNALESMAALVPDGQSVKNLLEHLAMKTMFKAPELIPVFTSEVSYLLSRAITIPCEGWQYELLAIWTGNPAEFIKGNADAYRCATQQETDEHCGNCRWRPEGGTGDCENPLGFGCEFWEEAAHE